MENQMSEMKVYTHYYKAKDAKSTEFRWRTLLQFGKSWDIIGSVVMKNPGSSKPKVKDANGAAISISDENILVKLREFNDLKIMWYEFKPDNTMACVKELFQKYYEPKELNGVIQIFNIFYIKDAILNNATKKDKKDFFEDSKKMDIKCPFKNNKEFEEKVLKKDFENLKIPIYLGFADFGTNEKYKERCKDFFEKAKDKRMKYCSEKFADNKFYHPLYLMRYGKNKPECQKVLQCFINSKHKD